MSTNLPTGQIRAHIGFPRSKDDSFVVEVDGAPIAKLHPTSIRYEMNFSSGLPRLVAEFIAGDADLETRPPGL